MAGFTLASTRSSLLQTSPHETGERGGVSAGPSALDLAVHTQRAQSLGHTFAAAGGAPVQMVDWKRAAKYGALGTLGAVVGAATAPAWIGAGLGAAGGAALGLGASGLHDWYAGGDAQGAAVEQAEPSRHKRRPKPKPKPKQKQAQPRRRRVVSADSSDEEEKDEKQPVVRSSQDYAALASHYDFLDDHQSKSSKRRQKKRENREREEAEAEERARAEQARQLAATRTLPRRVVRHDRDFDKATNRSGQGKAHRVDGNLVPAGNTPVSAVEQLHQDSPNKGTSNRTSFASLDAADANDYSAGGMRPSVHFKFRKARRAQIKGKDDATGFRALSGAQVLSEIQQDNSAYGKANKHAARNFARKDGEHQTVGTVPARFLKFSDEDSKSESDSDSDNESTDDEK